MPKFLKTGKVVILLNGRFAGRKAVIVQNYDTGDKGNKYGYGNAIVAGIDKYPQRVARSMAQKTIEKKSRVRPFFKRVNYTHFMPTRYSVTNIDFKKIVSEESFQPEKRKATNAALRKEFEEKYITGQNKWFFKKLRF
eukprot:TRINITY_DN9239_c0_g1_i4.p1 TRINITY_DN9239_c0_g1~~TRINITY_DN9239_c0_g1_i4.p1  ORF type:complete len:138 (-),score=22.44 TRINITY_DN9239_c0_g1_i4:38-451(-)